MGKMFIHNILGGVRTAPDNKLQDLAVSETIRLEHPSGISASGTENCEEDDKGFILNKCASMMWHRSILDITEASEYLIIYM